MEIKNSRFHNNVGSLGGAIYAITALAIEQKLKVESSHFINNTALSSGAIHISNHIIEIHD